MTTKSSAQIILWVNTHDGHAWTYAAAIIYMVAMVAIHEQSHTALPACISLVMRGWGPPHHTAQMVPGKRARVQIVDMDQHS
jgi:hypothetical protein